MMKALLLAAFFSVQACLLAGSLEVLKAEYGAGDKWKDVTETVRGAVHGETLSIEANNDKFGDPAEGVEKTLRATLRLDGKTFSVRAEENSTLSAGRSSMDKQEPAQFPGLQWSSATPSDNGAELSNPGMGFVLHYYDNSPTSYGSKLAPDDLLTDWPGLSLVYLRIPWSYIEPEEGKFNWSVLDTPIQRYGQRGIRSALRLTCSESWMEYPTPKWVADAGAKGYRFTPGKGIVPDGKYWEPDYDDPVFLQKLDKFLKAVAERYDNDPGMDFIDVGSFGVWGEGHTWSSTRKAYSDETIQRIVDLHLKRFKKLKIIAQDDFASRPRVFVPAPAGQSSVRFDMVIPAEFRGRSFAVMTGLWQDRDGGKGERLKPLGDSKDSAVQIGLLSIDKDAKPSFVASPSLKAASQGDFKNGEAFAIERARIVYDGEQQPHSLKIEAGVFLPAVQPDRSGFFAKLFDPESGKEACSINIEHEDDALMKRLASQGLGVRDDSILVNSNPCCAYYHGLQAQDFWRTGMVVLECEHFNPKVEKWWGDGLPYLFCVEDYHASYAAIHWWPREFLAKNRELVRKMNLRIGYRYLPVKVSWTSSMSLKDEFSVKWEWRNEGVAPSYSPLYPTITLKDAKGGIVAVFADESFRLDSVPVLSGGVSQAVAKERSFPIPFQLKPGSYDVFVSVGEKGGKPLIELPLDGSDGAKRYKIGTCSTWK